jgi:hypothetical protein
VIRCSTSVIVGCRSERIARFSAGCRLAGRLRARGELWERQ